MTKDKNVSLSPATFEVRLGLVGTTKADWLVCDVWDNGADAATIVTGCKAQGCIYIVYTGEWRTINAGETLAVVRVPGVTIDPDAPIVDWRSRELERFASGRYKTVPWSDVSDGSPENHCGWRDHYAHLAESDSRKIAFTESEAKGLADVQKVLGVEEYLNRYWTGALEDKNPEYGWLTHPAMTGDWRSTFANLVTGVSLDLKITSTPEEMIAIYERVGSSSSEAGSCMGYDESHFSTDGIHPVRVYAEGGDLALAYIEGQHNGSSNCVLGRCLVWPERKTYGRMYAVSGKAILLAKALRLQGYSECKDWLRGAKLAVIPLDEYGGRYVMPYIDSKESHTFGGDPEDGYFVIGGDHAASNQNGVSIYEMQSTCCYCEETVSDSDVRTDDHGDICCSGCYSDRYPSCDECCETVSRDDVDSIQMVGSRYHVTVCSSCREDLTELPNGRYAPTDDTYSCIDCDETTHCGVINMSPTDDEPRCDDCHEMHLDAVAEETGVARPVMYSEVPTVETLAAMFLRREGYSMCSETCCAGDVSGAIDRWVAGASEALALTQAVSETYAIVDTLALGTYSWVEMNEELAA